MINMDDFLKCDLRVGQILSAAPNPTARVPAYVLQIDFGDALGVLQSSAQLCDNYQPHDLVGKKIIAVVNFPAKKSCRHLLAGLGFGGGLCGKTRGFVNP